MTDHSPAVNCAACRHFTPNPVNPLAGLGACQIDAAGDSLPWPNLTRQCDRHHPTRPAVFAAAVEACHGTRLDPSRLTAWLIEQQEPAWLTPPAVARWARLLETLLKDDEWSQWTDSEIARRCAVHHSTVAAARSSLAKSASEQQATRTYTTKHGTTATMNTSNIGKKQKPLSSSSVGSPSAPGKREAGGPASSSRQRSPGCPNGQPGTKHKGQRHE